MRLHRDSRKLAPKVSSKFRPLETLESRQLLSVVNVTGFGAIPNDGRDDSAAINSALRAAQPGDTVMVPAGTFNLSNFVTVPSGVTFRGVDGTNDINMPGLPKFLTSSSNLVFNLSGSGYGIHVASNGQNIQISDLNITSSSGAIQALDGNVSNIAILRNSISAHGLYFIRVNYATGLSVNYNYFHDGDGADRSFEGWSIDQASFDDNVIYHVNQGFHIYEPKHNVQVEYNAMRQVRLMGVEIQGVFPNTNLLVQGNVYYDALTPGWGTFGISVPTNNGINTQILNNYVRSDFTGAWANPSKARFGYAIEIGGNGNGDTTARALVANNILGGPNPWFNFVVADTAGARVQNNAVYGYGVDGDFAGEPGDTGFGSVSLSGNTIDRDYTHMPPPPAWVNGGVAPTPTGGTGVGGGNPFDPTDPTNPTGGDPTPTGPAPTGLATYLSAFVNDSSRIALSWIDSYTNEDGYRLERSTDGDSFDVIYDSKAPNVVQYQDKGIPSGTTVWYRVVAYLGDVQGAYSNIVQARTKGLPPSTGPNTNSLQEYHPNSAPTPGLAQATTKKIPPIFSDDLIETL